METNTKPYFQSMEIARASLERIVSSQSSIKRGEEAKFASLLILWGSVVEDTFLSYGVSSMDRSNIGRWLRKMAATQIRLISAAYGDVLDCVRRSDTFDAFVLAFKGQEKERGCTGDFFTPVAHYCKCAPDTHREGTVWFRVVTQILSFPFRANLDTPSLDEAWASYIQIDEECVECEESVIKELAQAYSFLIDDSLVAGSKFTPRHGPGVIAEWDRRYAYPRDMRSKYREARIPQIVAYALAVTGCEYHDYGFPLVSSRRPCRFKPVPKSIGKTRTICIEPSGMQFYQQGLRILLEDVIQGSRLSQYVNFKHTDKSVRLARIGSMDGSFSTIDLSNASDRIPYSLMRGVLKDSSLLPLLVACRSHSVEFRGRIVKLHKLHTSGSSACFPTETLLFALMCQVALWRTVRTLRPNHTQYDFAVFGDDIVISTPCIPALLEILQSCGSKVNTTKSFVNSRFTECCGYEFFKGVDVTPLRIPRKFNLWDLQDGGWYGEDIESFNQCIDLANKCLENGLFGLRKQILRSVFSRQKGSDNPAFGPTAIFSYWVRNDHLRKDVRLSRDYQRKVLLAKRVVATVHTQDMCVGSQCANSSAPWCDSDVDLLHWFVCSDLRSEEQLSYGTAILERRSKKFDLCPIPMG